MPKALYRAYRPQTFEEVVGQDAIVTALKNQIRTGQIGHAYLFSGTRGTGKTSCAKIFARGVNCLEPNEGDPCNVCANCRAILDETTMDVVEMDAASNRRIDDIRELRETVIYPPAQLRYKVYIIDEAHMITNEAFNALLKIMEEPPAHLIFVLATTEPEKIPQTILSRVQRYEFKRIPPEIIAAQVEKVAKDVGLTIDPDARMALALASDGAMRDALSLLDQVLAMGETHITAAKIDRVLGTAGRLSLDALTEAVLHDHMGEALRLAQQLLREGKEVGTLLHEWMEMFRRLLLLKGGGDAIHLPISTQEREKLSLLLADVSLERLLDSIDILTDTSLLQKKSEAPDVLFLAAVARLINYVSTRDLRSRLSALEEKLANVERWQSPEKMIREEVERQVQAFPKLRTNPASPRFSVENLKEATDDVSPESAEHYSDPPTPSQTQTEPAARATSEFARDPEGWFQANGAQWRQRVADAKIIVPAMLGHYDGMRLLGNTLYVHYPEGSLFASLIKPKAKELSLVLQEMTGEKIVILPGENPSREGSIKQKESLVRDPALEKLQKMVPAEKLTIEE